MVMRPSAFRANWKPGPANGAPLACVAAAEAAEHAEADEAEAVRETVAILKQADLAPLDVTGYGTLSEREAQGHDIHDDERELMQRALEENSVVVAQMTPFFNGEEAASDDLIQ